MLIITELGWNLVHSLIDVESNDVVHMVEFKELVEWVKQRLHMRFSKCSLLEHAFFCGLQRKGCLYKLCLN